LVAELKCLSRKEGEFASLLMGLIGWCLEGCERSTDGVRTATFALGAIVCRLDMGVGQNGWERAFGSIVRDEKSHNAYSQPATHKTGQDIRSPPLWQCGTRRLLLASNGDLERPEAPINRAPLPKTGVIT